MLYLVDAYVLIRAHEDYYPLDRVRPFWDWLIAEAAAGHTKMPFEIYDEIASASGPLKDWIAKSEVKDTLVLDDETHFLGEVGIDWGTMAAASAFLMVAAPIVVFAMQKAMVRGLIKGAVKG